MDWIAYLRFAAALATVLGLIVLIGWLLRRYGPAGMATAPGRSRRLALVESLPLDPRRRLVLIRRDGTEHLLLIGPSGETVVETGIRPGSADGEGRP